MGFLFVNFFSAMFLVFSVQIFYLFSLFIPWYSILGLPYGSDSKESAYNAGELNLIPGLGRSPGEGNGNPTTEFVPGK